MEEQATHLEKIKAQVRDCASEVNRLAAKASRASGETRAVYEEEVGDLQRQCDILTHKLEDVQWSEEAWDDVKHGVEAATKSLKSAVEKAKSRFE